MGQQTNEAKKRSFAIRPGWDANPSFVASQHSIRLTQQLADGHSYFCVARESAFVQICPHIRSALKWVSEIFIFGNIINTLLTELGRFALLS